MRKQYPATSAVELAGRLKRSLVSVQKQLRDMGIGRRKEASWTPDDANTLRKMLPTMAIWEIANKLDKTPSQVKHKIVALRLKK